ncbi:unnamed protein product [Rhizopus stolonifer]
MSPKKTVRKPKAGVRIAAYKPDQSIPNLPSGFLDLGASGWTSPSKIIRSISSDHIRATSPNNAYHNVLATLSTIANTTEFPQQLKTYANACHEYASYSNFARDFDASYAARRIQLDDVDVRIKINNLNKQSIKNALSITSRSLNKVHETVLHNFDIFLTSPQTTRLSFVC